MYTLIFFYYFSWEVIFYDMMVYIDTVTFFETERKTLQSTIHWKSERLPDIFQNPYWPRNSHLERCVKRHGHQPSPCRITVQHLHWSSLWPPELKRRDSRRLKHQGFGKNPPSFLVKRNWMPLMSLWTVSKWTCNKLRW